MKSIISASLWTIGALFFLVVFCIIALGMILFSPKTIYPAVRILTRIQQENNRIRNAVSVTRKLKNKSRNQWQIVYKHNHEFYMLSLISLKIAPFL